MACAEFRKFRLELDTGSNLYERKHIADPPGFDPNIAREQGEGAVASRKQGLSFQKRQEALFSKSWAPLKQIGMLAFMMWMSGSQLHLFSIMTTISGIYQPLTAILKSGEVFPPDPEGKLNTFIPRLLFCLINGGGLAFAGYRINQMGLLPTHLSDWVSSIKAPQVLEHAAGGLLQGHS